MDKLQKLKKIKELLDDGIITKEEFNDLKDEILGTKKSLLPLINNIAEENEFNEIKEELVEKTEPIKTEFKETIQKQEEDVLKEKTSSEVNKKSKKKSSKIPKIVYLIPVLIIPLLWWFINDTEDEKENEKNQQEIIVNTSYNKTLTISGKDIWVRDTPKTGEVISKLDDNIKVMVSDSCCYETIKGNASYWYKINYNGQSGWFFGSQTKEYLTSQKIDESINIPDNSNSLNLKLIRVSCYEGNECTFEFVDSNSKELIFDWFLEPVYAEKDSYEDIFMKKYGTGYDGFNKYYGKKFTVYFSKNDKFPGTCEEGEMGLNCTKILNMHLYNAQ